MTWRLAKSLETLRLQVDAAYPNRSKLSDGTIGDTSHAASASDHNPNPNGVVTALDLTHDPKNGFDAHALAEHLRTNRHPNLRYVISNARIAGAWTNWNWSPSSGHTHHAHISVGNSGVPDGQTTSNYDSTKLWSIKEDEMFNGKSAEFWYNETSRRGLWLDKVGDTVGVDFVQKVSDVTAEAKSVNAIVAAIKKTQATLSATQEALKKSNAALDLALQSEAVKGELEKQLNAAIAENDKLIAKISALEAEKQLDTETGNAFLRWLGNIIRGGN